MKLRRVLCVGNALCHDDGVALAVAEQLRNRHVDATILEAGEFGLSCLDAFTGARQVVVVDAVTTGKRPGQCAVWNDLSFIPSSTCSVGHAVSLSSMLELVGTLSGNIVPRVSVVGIEAENLNPFGYEMTEAVRNAIPEAVQLVLSELACPIELTGSDTGVDESVFDGSVLG
jgi:hydrogenase maturation protease